MHPVLIRFGPLTIHTYGFLIAVGFLVALWLATLQAKKEGIQTGRIMDLGFYILLAAIIGSRLFFVFLNAGHYFDRPLDIVKIWEGGLVFYGGVLLAVPVAVWYMEKNGLALWSTADIFAPSIAIGHVFGRLGCLAAGCCHGKAADGLPWGIIFTDPECLAPTHVLLHPTQLYESAGELIIFLVLILLRSHKSFTGQLFMMYLIFYAVLRFIVEFFRGDVARGFIMGGLSVSQGISLLLFIAGLAGFIALRKRNPVS
jgi:phosphatidylglycerol:prolipoprotein diacylglycerol transferase